MFSTHRNLGIDREKGASSTRRQLLLRAALLLPIAALVTLAFAELHRKAAVERALEGIRKVGGLYARDQAERDRPVVSVDLCAYQIDDTGMVHRKGPARDSELALLLPFHRLRDLSLEKSAVSDAGLVHLAGLKSLQRLSLRGTAITDAGLSSLRDLSGLTLLDLRDTRTTAAGIAALRTALPGTVILSDVP
jgi:hypothetical protein